MNSRAEDKIVEIEKYLVELEEAASGLLEDYINSRRAQLVCERLFEIIIESIIDLVFIFINEKKFEMPEDDESSLDLIASKNIISSLLGKKLKEARRMRNIVAHKYGSINNEIVFNAIKENLPQDARELIKCIRDYK